MRLLLLHNTIGEQWDYYYYPIAHGNFPASCVCSKARGNTPGSGNLRTKDTLSLYTERHSSGGGQVHTGTRSPIGPQALSPANRRLAQQEAHTRLFTQPPLHACLPRVLGVRGTVKQQAITTSKKLNENSMKLLCYQKAKISQ